MKVKIDNKLNLSLFGQRTPRTDSSRYYYQVVGYDCLVVVFWDDDYRGWQGKHGVTLWNFDTIDGRIICDLFPNAPARWRREPHLIQCTIRPTRRIRGRTKLLSEAVAEMIGDSY